MARRKTQHAIILEIPYGDTLVGAHLDGLEQEKAGERTDLHMDYKELRLTAPLELVRCEGRLCEQVRGEYHPRRLRFLELDKIERTGVFAHLEEAPADHGVRTIEGIFYWSNPEDGARYLLFDRSPEPAFLMFSAEACQLENRQGPIEKVEMIRDWSPPPLLIPGLVPRPKNLYAKYGGDPVTLRMGGHRYSRRLFVGGLDTQGTERPQVDAVLNLGELPSKWVTEGKSYPMDRWVEHGEGRHGMTMGEMEEEAQWVIERLRKGQTVLVHCAAGLNRSTTICCAVLILLETLSAETALARVREHHPWARPDSHHWLMLKWLAKLIPEAMAWDETNLSSI